MAGLIVCAWQQTRYWYDSETLWTRALACSSQNPLAYTSLGNALAGRRRVDEAIAQYRKALEIEPDHAGAHTNLGNALAGRGELDEAIAHYRKALEIEPDHVEAHNNLGNALSNHGEVEAAIAHYRMALAIKADFVEAHNNLGTALARRGDVDEAMAHFRQALEIAPDCAEIHCNLGRALRTAEDSMRRSRISRRPSLWPPPRTTGIWPTRFGPKSGATNRLRPAATHRKGRQRSKKCKRSAEGCQDAYNTAGFRSTQALPRRVVSAKAVALCPFRRLPRPIFPISTEEVYDGYFHQEGHVVAN